ncbi:23S rRNA (pseudouridine(1915)-N(3))-methyltransferase RlmH [Thermosyntropha sp.]|uniref:23S rRNA (pseudouridine(1915)-N(3))-methyltransferase RlmH n=1 Tax=Thermosyntropha sp. TaxID=2740820 RepID=UPI0025DCBD32|nr:23S rRNA (pseudouridine(1915)-N(3))-methyltransferase RlmH [Thermosyntropha sp.]MBO8159635.1 23S rRNA (pseudouridine(1915)-N(3))-methyltransferase RlmH [Thermosyntropha sp.]
MKYRIISVGKIKEPFYAEGVKEYAKRLTPYCSLDIVEGLEEKISPKAKESEIEKVLEKEGEKILNLLGEDDYVIVLDVTGKQMSSEELAQFIKEVSFSGKGRVSFIIGGSNGLAQKVKKRGDYVLSFSRLTFPHQMAVLILAEQLYRSFKIIKGEPYHK